MGKAKQVWQGVKFAGIVASGKALGQINRGLGQRFMCNMISSMPGLPAKAGQLMMMKMNIDPEAIQPSRFLDISEVKKIICASSPDLADDIESISDDPIVASIGQVHSVVLKDGTQLSMKVQFPNITREIDGQLDLLLRSATVGAPKRFKFDVLSYKDFLQDRLNQEVDYLKEAEVQHRFRNVLAPINKVVIPKVYHQYSTAQLLVQSWEESTPLSEAVKWSTDEKRICGTLLAEFFFRACLQFQAVHTDMHPGNWGFRKNSDDEIQLILYDFGSTLDVTLEHSQALMGLINAYLHKQPVPVFDYLVFLGFDPEKLSHISAKLPAICERLFEPLTQDRAWLPKDWNIADHYTNILGDDAWWFRSAGPPWFFYYLRSLHGITHGISKLDVPIALKQLISKINTQVKISGLQVPDYSHYLDGQKPQSTDCADFLRVTVKEEGREIVDLTMPSRSVDDLSELISQETYDKIEAENVKVSDIVSRAQSSGYLPQSLFEANTGDRNYRVWLE